jgi:regulator of protease activity HflC (stomatin/prohibitin superfamily)
MFNIGFFKGQPTEYVMKYVAGRLTKEGPGLAFYYLKHRTHIVAIPTSSQEASFVFNETSNNFQAVTIQGQFTYRIYNPRAAAELLNFRIDPQLRSYVSEDPERLRQRIANIVQMETRREIGRRTLEETLSEAQAIAVEVLRRIRDEALLEPMGVELMSIYFLSTKPTPEVSKALEAEYREALLRKADEAIYHRRARAVEEERKIKENELNTDITLEQQRQSLIALEGQNALQKSENWGQAFKREAEYRSQAVTLELSVYQQMDPRLVVALAMKELGQNAGKLGNLTITTEILGALLDGKPRG